MATTSTTQQKKPYPDFPLSYHPCGQWVKKIKGKLHYFGTDPDAALSKYQEQRDDLQAGRKPRTQADALTIRELCNKFLTSKKSLMDSGELSPRTWKDYYDACENLTETFGRDRVVLDLASDDFEKLRSKIGKTCGPVTLGNRIQHTRTILKYAYDDNLIDRPVRFGTQFRKPSRKTIRKARHANGGKMIEADELRRILDASKQPLRAMILLALNGGFGQSDLASLPHQSINLKTGWIDYPRPKTGIARRVPLWSESMKALREAIENMPKAKDTADADLVFITKYGKCWVRFPNPTGSETVDVVKDRKKARGVAVDSIGLEFNKILTNLKLKRPGLGFYALRHIFRTIADRSKDQPAVDHIMGARAGDMASQYRERIDDDRLHAVVEVVRLWLWPTEKVEGETTRLPLPTPQG